LLTSLSLSSLFSFLLHPPPSSTLFPYTTLFRSIPALPLAGFLLNGLLGARLGKKFVTAVALVASGGAAVAGTVAVAQYHAAHPQDRKSTRLNSSHLGISYAVFCLKKKKTQPINILPHVSRFQTIAGVGVCCAGHLLCLRCEA